MIEKLNIKFRKKIAQRKHGSVDDEQDKKKFEMLDMLKELSDQTEHYEIPIQKNLVYSFAKNPHLLITGGTGSGKSYFTNYLITMASLKGANLFICDPKNSDLAGLSRVISNHKVVSEAQEILNLIREYKEIMDNRYAYINELKEKKNLFSGDFTDFDIPVALLVIDELGSLMSQFQKKEKDEFKAILKQVINKGRQAGCNVCLITQRANAENIPTEIRDQMSFRCFLGEPKQQDKIMVFGDGYEYIKRVYDVGEGLFYLDGKTDNPALLQTPFYDESQLESVYKYAFMNQYLYEDGGVKLMERITPSDV